MFHVSREIFWDHSSGRRSIRTIYTDSNTTLSLFLLLTGIYFGWEYLCMLLLWHLSVVDRTHVQSLSRKESLNTESACLLEQQHNNCTCYVMHIRTAFFRGQTQVPVNTALSKLPQAPLWVRQHRTYPRRKTERNWGLWSSRLWRRVVLHVVTNVSGKLVASVEIGCKASLRWLSTGNRVKKYHRRCWIRTHHRISFMRKLWQCSSTWIIYVCV